MRRRSDRITLRPRQRERLLEALRTPTSPGMAFRAAVILWSAQGQSAKRIARTLGVTPRVVHKCRQRWRRTGLRGLADAPRPGRPPRVDAATLRLLVRTVETDPRTLGFAFARWTRGRLAAFVRARTGLVIRAYWVGELLRRHGFVWRRTQRTTRHLADPGEKSARRAAPAQPATRGPPARRALRVVVRRRRPLRLAAGDPCDVAAPRDALAGQDPGQERQGRRGRRAAVSGPAVPLHPQAAERDGEPGATARPPPRLCLTKQCGAGSRR